MSEQLQSVELSNESIEKIVNIFAVHLSQARQPVYEPIPPCPFCGGNVQFISAQTFGNRGAMFGQVGQCRECGLQTPIRQTNIEAETLWRRICARLA